MGIGLFEALLIIFVILLLFGSAKIPTLMRGVGAGVHEFKKGIQEGGQEKPTPSGPAK
jgi:sec-independent protein translocase protein TatA